MMILKNAWRNIWRSKGRNILILLIVSIIAVASCVSLSIKNSAKTAEQSGLDSLSITATISVDRQAMMNSVKNSGADIRSAFSNMASELTLDELQLYAGVASVDSFTYSMSTSLAETDDFTAVTTDTSSETTETENSNNQNGIPGGGFGGSERISRKNIIGGMGSEGDFTLVGYGSYTAMTSFVSGNSSITDGSIFTLDNTENNCIINSELATYNDISVGDIITVLNPNDQEETITLTVCGIYQTTESSETTGMMRFSSANDPANQIYTNYETVDSIVNASKTSATTETDDTTGMTKTTALRGSVSGVYHFADVEQYEAFEPEARALGLEDSYTVSSTDVDSYEQSILPLKNLSKFAGTLLWIVLGVGGLILVAFNIFNIRERKFEVGVLTAIGMKKPKVATQFVVELFMVTIIGICIGTAIGVGVSVPASNAMLSLQTSSQQTQQEKLSQNFGMGGQQMTADGRGFGGGSNNATTPSAVSGNGRMSGFMNASVETISEINATINLVVLWQLLLVGIGLTIVSSLAAVIFVLRYEPLKILSERN